MMMAEAARALPLELSLLAGSPGEPAVTLIPNTTLGSAGDGEAVLNFATACEAITVDHEVVNIEALRSAESRGVRIAPGPDALIFATDKAHQRRVFASRGIPLPDFIIVDDLDDPAFDAFCETHSHVVIKAARGGFDGRGVIIPDAHPREALREILASGPAVVEEKLELLGELAVSIVTSATGERVAYQPVDTIQVKGMCDQVNIPSRRSHSELHSAVAIASEVADIVGAVGVLAVELFVTPRGVLVNEVATRPHNSGHWSIEGATTSQFENHLRAVAGLDLGSTAATSEFITMINVVGGETSAPDLRSLVNFEGIFVHDYSKAWRPGRKLGHVTICAHDEATLERRIALVRQAME